MAGLKTLLNQAIRTISNPRLSNTEIAPSIIEWMRYMDAHRYPREDLMIIIRKYRPDFFEEVMDAYEKRFFKKIVGEMVEVEIQAIIRATSCANQILSQYSKIS